MAALQDVSLVDDNKFADRIVAGISVGGKEVTIRNMAAGDADFVGEMTIEAFHDKMEYAVGTEGLSRWIKGNQDYHRMATDSYKRSFIAEVGGERAGYLQIARREDNLKEPDDFSWFDYLTCCAKMRFTCLACYEGCFDVPAEHCYVEAIAVDAKFRGYGVGKALLDRADQEGRALGCKTMSLEVTTTNRAKNLYSRQGYVVTRRIDGCCFTSCSFGVRYFYRMEKQL